MWIVSKTVSGPYYVVNKLSVPKATAAAATAGSLLEMQIESQNYQSESSGAGSRNFGFNESSKGSLR